MNSDFLEAGGFLFHSPALGILLIVLPIYIYLTSHSISFFSEAELSSSRNERILFLVHR